MVEEKNQNDSRQQTILRGIITSSWASGITVLGRRTAGNVQETLEVGQS